jgi:branched-chain amino acid transport system permease protein
MHSLIRTFYRNRSLFIALLFLVVLFLLFISGMETQDWVITLLRALSVGSVTFLVASGFSIIFGLMDVLNLAHGTLFMIGAYIGWTVFVRPDTFIDVLTPACLIAGGFALLPVWLATVNRFRVGHTIQQIWPWIGMIVGLVILVISLRQYPITIWDPRDYTNSPIVYAIQAGQGQLIIPEPVLFTTSPYMLLFGLILAGILIPIGLAGFLVRGQYLSDDIERSHLASIQRNVIWLPVLIYAIGLSSFMFHGFLRNLLTNIDTSLLFCIAVAIAFLIGFILGILIETTLIRPLYVRPLYQILMTLGISLIGVEFVRTVWGRPEFTMPKPGVFNGTGPGCPAENLGDLIANQCSTLLLFGSRVRTYNEIFVPLVGLIVLILVWVLLQRTRLGMIIRAGVQDSEMVEALGINVRRVFTMVFGLGVALAAMGGTIAAPAMGLSNGMGDTLLINALVALAIGGLTSFPGAAVGSLLVGFVQQFIIKYGQIGITLPFLAEPFKPSPPLVPASTILLMVLVLLILPQGLFGRKE